MPTNVPTKDEFDALARKVANHEARIAALESGDESSASSLSSPSSSSSKSSQSSPSSQSSQSSQSSSSSSSSESAPSQWTDVAVEGGSFYVGEGQLSRFGADARWVERPAGQGGIVQCTNAAFGSDPALGTLKRCEVLGPQAQPPMQAQAQQSLSRMRLQA